MQPSRHATLLLLLLLLLQTLTVEVAAAMRCAAGARAAWMQG
jgi:hypothetical protein